MDTSTANDNIQIAIDMLDKHFRDISSTMNTEIQYSKAEIESLIKPLLEDVNILRNIFIAILRSFECTKFKNCNVQNDELDTLLQTNKHQIIINIYNSDIDTMLSSKSSYKYNCLAWFIVLDKFLKRASTSTDISSCAYFISNCYEHMRQLIEWYSTRCLRLRTTGFKSNMQRNDIDILSGIQSLLYNRTPSDTSSHDFVNISIFSIRGFIEFWIRKSIPAILPKDGQPVAMSFILKIIKMHAERTTLPPDNNISSLVKHIDCLSAINTWSNTFIHCKQKPLFWAPHFIKFYLDDLIDECQQLEIKKNGNYTLTPPLISREICEEIHDTIYGVS